MSEPDYDKYLVNPPEAEFDGSDYERARENIDREEFAKTMYDELWELLDYGPEHPIGKAALKKLDEARDAVCERWLRDEKEYGGFDG